MCNFMDMSLEGRGIPLSDVPFSPHSSWNMVMEVGMMEQQDRAAWVSEPQKQNIKLALDCPLRNFYVTEKDCLSHVSCHYYM